MNNGGPAFPSRFVKHEVGEVGNQVPILEDSSGISVRDYFAGQALVSYIFPEMLHGANTEEEIKLEFTNCAAFAYRMADAMLVERLKA